MSWPNVPEGQFKHSMMDPQFGKLVPSDFPDERDAIHIATAAVFAEHDLNPGDHVGLTTEAPDVMGRSDIAPRGRTKTPNAPGKKAGCTRTATFVSTSARRPFSAR